MIARIWHGMTNASDSEAYEKLLNRTGVPDSRATKGNQGVYVLRKIENDRTHWLFISLWESFDAIKKFAGADVEKARYYEEDKNFLLDFEPNVAHYEVLVKPGRSSKKRKSNSRLRKTQR